MARGRSILLLLGALIAALAVPASASAAVDNLTPPPPSGGWIKDGHTITWPVAYPGGYLIDQVEWQLDGGDVQTGPQSSSVVIAGGPVVTLTTRIHVVDNGWSNYRTDTYNIDGTPPLDLTTVEAFWRNGPVDIPLVGSADGSSPVAKFQWKLGEELQPIDTVGFGPWTAHVVPDGRQKLYTRAVDMVGNASEWKTHDVYIDSQPPLDQTKVQAGWYTTSPVTIDIEGTDVTSGIQTVRWRTDTSDPFQPASRNPYPLTFSSDGAHPLDVEFVDNAGRVSATGHHTVRIDTVDPTNMTTAAPSGTVDSPYRVTVDGTDATSGVDRVEWRVNGGGVQWDDAGTQVTVAGHGDVPFETRVVDKAGRTSPWRPETLHLDAKTNDSTAPTQTTTTAGSSWYTAEVPVTIEATDGFGSGVREVQWHIATEADPIGSPIRTALGSTASFTLSDEGEYLVKTRARDIKNNASPWQEQTFKIDLAVPVNTTDITSSVWQKSRTFKLSGTDSASGIRTIRYRIDAGAYQDGTEGQDVNVGGDGKFVVRTYAIDNAEQESGIKRADLWVDAADPIDDTVAPAAGWRSTPLSHPVAGSDALSGVKVVQWRVDGGDIHDGGPAVVDTDGDHTLETRVVDNAGNDTDWQEFDVSVDTTAPENKTDAAPSGWLNGPYNVTIVGDDGDGSDVDRIERTVDGGAVSNDPDVTISGDGEHTLRSRIIDKVGHASEWRVEKIKIDGTAPSAALSCSAGPSVWSSAPVSCSVSANGGDSGLPSLTLSGADGGTTSISSGATATVSSDGTHTLRLEATDGAGNHAATTAVVNVDRTAPAAGLSCSAADGKYSCIPSASDAMSGVTALGWSVDGGAYTPIAAGSKFTVAKGSIRVRAVDVAGNVFVTEPVTLSAIPVGATARIASTPVYLGGRKRTGDMLGAIDAARSPNGTVSLDLGPLAVGRGSYRVEIAMKSGKRSKKVKRTYKVGSTGALPRVSASLGKAVEKCTVTVTVRKKAGRSWRKHAGTRLVLAK